ncbi:MAG: NAD(P)-binding protein [Vicinamibacteria bacterium]
MRRRITRRDFLNGAAVGIGGILASRGLSADALADVDPARAPDYYPPALTGLRGSHEGSYAVAHSLKDGAFWGSAGPTEDTGETYDLVVVGGGLSGLSAAYFFRQAAGPKARILILENHDDFGGHARRNEFRHGNRLLLSYGGTQSIESPSKYSAVGKKLLHELGIETQRFYTAYDQKLYASMRLGSGAFFDKETFGADRLVAGIDSRPPRTWLAETPLSETARRDLERLYVEKRDHLPGLSVRDKEERLARMSYADFLTKAAGASPEVLPFLQTRTHDLWGLGVDAIPALACARETDDYGVGYPGFGGIGLAAETAGGREEPYIFHFPDGNASIARMLVRSLMSATVAGHTMEDIVTARLDYGRLDEASSSVRLRLNSTVVRARHLGDPASAREVEVAYVRGGKLESVRAGACVLACWNGIIPHLCPELPAVQKDALAYGVKVPFLYTHVLIRNWTAFQKLGVHQVSAPGSYHSWVALDFPVSLGTYRFPRSPDEPMVLFLMRAPCRPGLPARDQHRAGRMELLSTTFETMERNIRDELGRMLGGGGFDPARDIEAITVNRWAHGYAYWYNTLFDPDWPKEERPCVVGRKAFGRLSIANSDAEANAYTQAAIDQAHRAVGEILAHRG